MDRCICMIWSILIYLFAFSSAEHDIHVSVSDIEIKETRVEVTIKTFLDDLQFAIGLTPGEELPADYTSADQMIAEYIADKILLSTDDDTISLEMTDLSASMDAVWITLEGDWTGQNNDKALTIVQSLLTEVYSDQTNLINVKWATGKDSALLDRKKKQTEIRLK